MSRLTKLAAGICGLGVVAVLSAPLMAQGPEGRGMRRHGPMRMGLEGLPLRGLDLTDAQREQVRGIYQRAAGGLQGHRRPAQDGA